MKIKNDEEMIAYCAKIQGLWSFQRWAVVGVIVSLALMLIIPIVFAYGCSSDIKWCAYIRSVGLSLVIELGMIMWLITRWNGDPLHRYILEKQSKAEAQPTSPGDVATRAAPEK